MKAIRQIIDYLRQRGELSTGQMSELATLGLIDWEDVAEPRSALDELLAPLEPLSDSPPATDLEDHVPQRRLPRRKGGGRRPKEADLGADELCRRLGDYFVCAAPRLVGLVRLAGLLAPCAEWSAGAVTVRQATVEQLAEAIARGLDGNALSLAELWDFLSEEEFRAVVPDSQFQGPVGVAYRALLAAADAGNLGRHASLLHHDEVQRMFNLRMAQRQTVRAWAWLYDRQPEMIGQFLQREHHWLAYWSMVILYTARRGKPGGYPVAGPHEDWPKRAFPAVAQLYRAWAHAAFMDPLAVIPLLHVHQSQSGNPRQVCLALRENCLDVLPDASRELVAGCQPPGGPTAVDWTQLAAVWDRVGPQFREHFSRAGVFLFVSGPESQAALWEMIRGLLLVGEACPGWTWLTESRFLRCGFLCPRSWDHHHQRFPK